MNPLMVFGAALAALGGVLMLKGRAAQGETRREVKREVEKPAARPVKKGAVETGNDADELENGGADSGNGVDDPGAVGDVATPDPDDSHEHPAGDTADD